jgi:hypothetical protein
MWGRLIGLAESLAATPGDLAAWAAGEHAEKCRIELLSPVAAADLAADKRYVSGGGPAQERPATRASSSEPYLLQITDHS